MKRLLIIAGLLIIGSVLFSTATGLAQNVRSGDNIEVSKGETVDSMLFAAGENIVIAGTVNGDVYCAGMNVSITGKVNGDIFCAAQNLSVIGDIEGSLRIAGQNVEVNSKQVEKIAVIGQSVKLLDQAAVSQDVMVAGQTVNIGGDIKRDLSIAGQNILVTNKVGRNIAGSVEKLTLASTAKVGGNIDVTSQNQVAQLSGSEVAGEVTRRIPKEQSNQSAVIKPISILYMLFALLIIALVLVVMFPGLFSGTDKRISIVPGKTALIGLAGLFLTPIILGLLVITLVGIPLAILMFFAWIVVLFLSGPVFAYTIGSKIWKKSTAPMLTMLIGSVILIVLYVIPVIGFFAALTAGILGTGAVLSEMFGLSEPTAGKPKAKAVKAESK